MTHHIHKKLEYSVSCLCLQSIINLTKERYKMSATKQEEKTTMVASNSKELESVISKAIKKVGASKENDLCKYLPVDAGGYMHHFTMRKMKSENPKCLSSMIEEFIIAVDYPVAVPPKPRAARGSRKRRDQVFFTKEDLERLLHMARCAGDRELITKLTPKKSLTAVKRELIASIRHSDVNNELWNRYVELVNGPDFSSSLSSSSSAMEALPAMTTEQLASQWNK